MNPLTLPIFVLAATLAAPFAPLAAQGPVQPGPEHQKFAAAAGTWDAVVESTGPDGKATQSKGISEQRIACGGLWLIDDFKAEFGGAPFEGHGVLGFDPQKGKYVQTWVDSMAASPMHMEGTFDAAGKALTMGGMGIGEDGKPQPMRHVTTWQDADTYVFEMFVPGPGGKEIRVLKITYTRRGAKTGGKPAK
jgi:hypothetical protein